MFNFTSGFRLAAACLSGVLGIGAALCQACRAADNLHDQGNAAQRMDQFVSSREFSGVVLVAREGHVLFEKAYGLANREHGVPNKLETKFRLASLTKQFTAMAVMILVERNKLSVTDPLCKYIENCPKAWADITVQHLLTHTSGIPDFTDFPDNDHYERLPMTPLATIARFRDKPLEFPPGARFSYDDSGYLLLGYIVERAAGEKYEDFLRKNIYAPLGMLNSGYDHPWIVLKDRASGYARRNGEIVNAEYMEMDQPFGGGSMYSTAGDLLRWDQALYTEKLISRRSLEQMYTPYQGPYPASRVWERGYYCRHQYGYGWQITNWFGRKLQWHSGGINGFRSVIMRYPENRTLVAVLANVEPPEPREIPDSDLREERMIVANGLSAIAFGLPRDSNPVSSTPSASCKR
jgi:CubicO group peptidase (beta-lactamase class C family)